MVHVSEGLVRWPPLHDEDGHAGFLSTMLRVSDATELVPVCMSFECTGANWTPQHGCPMQRREIGRNGSEARSRQTTRLHLRSNTTIPTVLRDCGTTIQTVWIG